ncbi:MAG: NAD-dependent epimerase/dehydratase family protein [Anaerolineaceae bacterium]|nr:NAD-dependent epimerase/dehydratase family protein [Anaerolineaceae bacterium]
MKALVTGATGFVGSHVARALVEAGHEVRVLHRRSSRMDALQGLDCEAVIGDVLEREALAQACQGCALVFHVAAVAAYWRTERSQMYAINVEGTRRVLAAARAADVRRVVFTSSAASLGLRRDGRPVDESARFNVYPHRFPYGHSKHLAERCVQHAVKEQGQDVVIVNPVIVTGPGDLNLISGRFVTEMQRLQWLIPVSSGGVGVVDVRDVARWHLAAAERGRCGERYILGNANYSLREWYALCARAVGVAPPLLQLPDAALPLLAGLVALARRLGMQPPADPSQIRMGGRRLHFVYDKAHRDLGPPQVDMLQSLQDTADWYRARGLLQEGRLGRLLRALRPG